MPGLVEKNDFLQVKEEDYDLAIAKYNMTDKMVRDSIESIHQWYKMQPHLPEGAFSDERLFRLLLSTDFSIEKVKQKIENLMTARNLMPEIMTGRDPCNEEMQLMRKYITLAVIPQRLDDMIRVTLFTWANEDLKNFNIWDLVKFMFIAYDYRNSSDVCLGQHYIFDLANAKLGHVNQMTPSLIKKTLFVMQECYGGKICGIHFLNIPTHAEIIVTIFKAGLSKKVSSRVHVYKDYQSLQNVFPKSILPSDVGGGNKSIQELSDDFHAQLVDPKVRQWFLDQEHLKADESKKIGGPSNMAQELLGMQGSFRKLDID